MDYVSHESVARAKLMERKLQSVRPEAGILFISVKPKPCKDGECSTFEVRIGVDGFIGDQAGAAVVRYALQDEIDNQRLTILTNVYRGVVGAASANPGDGKAGPHPS